jgi:ElaB/YqjD/DUF883 family membrane-anchored ribosome-binding protein
MQNHCSQLDNYIEKYLPIHTQIQMTETLMSVLGGRERRRLELYDSDKNSLLYAHLLDDDGTGNVQELMRILHDKASEEIEKQEKAKKKAMAVSEASKTNLNLTPTVSAQMKNNAEATDEEVVPTKTKKAKAEV